MKQSQEQKKKMIEHDEIPQSQPSSTLSSTRRSIQEQVDDLIESIASRPIEQLPNIKPQLHFFSHHDDEFFDFIRAQREADYFFDETQYKIAAQKYNRSIWRRYFQACRDYEWATTGNVRYKPHSNRWDDEHYEDDEEASPPKTLAIDKGVQFMRNYFLHHDDEVKDYDVVSPSKLREEVQELKRTNRWLAHYDEDTDDEQD